MSGSTINSYSEDQEFNSVKKNMIKDIGYVWSDLPILIKKR